MSAGSWVLYLLLALAAAALVLWLYLRLEPPGRGRPVLAALRIATFGLVLLLIFDPPLPGDGRVGGPGRVQVLLDASASMNLPLGPGAETTRWEEAVRAAGERGGTPILFGETARPVPLDSLPPVGPGDARSLLLPALQAAAEAGSQRVVVITDAALEDAAVLGGWLARLGLGVEWVRLGERVPGLALTEVTAPGWVQAGEAMDIDVTLASFGGATETRLVVRQDGRVIGESTVAAPAEGRTAAARITVRPNGSPEGGFATLEVSVEPGDAIDADDRRLVSVFISAEPAGVAVVSLQPDWEARFLLPVLGRSLGMPARGYLRAGPAGWVRVAEGQQAGQRIAEGDVVRAVAAADLVVLHGVREPAPPWVLEALRAAPRLLVLAGDGTASLPLPVSIGAPVAADWFVAPDIPASPAAPLLADAPLQDVPPLTALAPVTEGAGTWTPLRATRGRGGPSVPLLVAGESDGRRWAVALGQGYWRWAFRGGDSRQLYERLWSAVTGWLVREGAGGGAGVRPARRVVTAGERSAWVAPGLRPDSLRLDIRGGAGIAIDTVLRAAAGDTLRAPLLPPGRYRYRATAFAGERTREGEGELRVETYAPELARPVVELSDIDAARALNTAAAGRSPVRPLHTSPVPWVLIVGLLGAEWILRRRWGLR